MPVSGVFAVSLLVLAGCQASSPLPLAPVEGKVTYQGKALDRGQVVFSPERGTPGPPAVGAIRHDGTYRMQTTGRDGAAVGKHLVTVHCRRAPTAEQARDPYFVPESLIPEKYGRQDQSPLRVEVKGGRNEHPIALE